MHTTCALFCTLRRGLVPCGSPMFPLLHLSPQLLILFEHENSQATPFTRVTVKDISSRLGREEPIRSVFFFFFFSMHHQHYHNHHMQSLRSSNKCLWFRWFWQGYTTWASRGSATKRCGMDTLGVLSRTRSSLGQCDLAGDKLDMDQTDWSYWIMLHRVGSCWQCQPFFCSLHTKQRTKTWSKPEFSTIYRLFALK